MSVNGSVRQGISYPARLVHCRGNGLRMWALREVDLAGWRAAASSDNFTKLARFSERIEKLSA